jgi:flagellar motility protein MotE (MotC chaperone)
LPKLEPEKLQKEEIDRYLTLIERKTQQVQERINFLKDREEKLQQIEGVIDDKLRKLDEERRFFGDTLQKEKDLSGERMDKLVDYYQKMAPKKAAPVFEKLNKDLVVELFKRLPQKQITSILELMPPEKSVELTEYYGRLRSGREYDMLKELNKSLRDEFAECKADPAS